jgi:phytoene dehydrogenase-like protein
MTETNTPIPLHDLLPAQVFRELKYKLGKNLPEPPSGDPADFERRLHSAIAEIAAYSPAGAAELNLARRYVEAAEAADECLRRAYQADRENSPDAMKRHALAASYMRQAHGYHSRLLRLQSERRKLEKDPKAASRAAWAEHCTIGLLTDADPPETRSYSPSPCGRGSGGGVGVRSSTL